MDDCKLVSAIITTHNRPIDIVLRAIHSVQAQEYGALEIIVVDDSFANYEYREKLKSCLTQKHNSVKYIQHEACLGACAARNTGLKIAKGEYVAFLDDDDEWLPKKLQIMVDVLERDNSVGLVYCNEIVVHDERGTEYEIKRKPLYGYAYDELLMMNYIGSTSIPVLRKKSLTEIGGFDVLMESAQDYDVWLRLSQNNKISFVDIPLVKYHIHCGEQISKNIKKRINGLERLYLKNQDAINTNSNIFWKRNIIMAPLYAEKGDINNALIMWCRAIKKRPFKVIQNIRYLLRVVHRIRNAKKR